MKHNSDAETCAPDVEKIKNHCKQNFEDEATIMQLGREDTQSSNLDSKYPRVSLHLCFKYPDCFICFYSVQ